MVCTLRNGYGLQVTGSGHLFDCSPPLLLRSSLLFSRFCFPLLELTPWFFCIFWEFRFCCCCGFFILLATPALEIPAFAQHPSAEEENPFAEDNTHLQKTHLLFLGFCFPEELGNVGEEFGAPIVIFLLHYGTHWRKSGHLGGGGRQGGKQTG